MLKQVAEGVLVHQSALLQNNTVVVQGDDGALLVDPGITNAELTCLTDDLRELGLPVTAAFATHPDWDHALWHPALGEAPRYGTARCAAELKELRARPDWRTRLADGLPPEIADDTPLDAFGLVTGLPAGAAHLPWNGPAIRVIEHPAHAPGHAALLIEPSRVLVAGDMLSDVLIPMLDDSADPIEDYLLGLRRLEEATAGIDIAAAVPGHGSVCGPDGLRTRIAQDRSYVHALREGRTPAADPRLGASARPGWEWVDDLHEGQVRKVARLGDT
ncbi:MBL fold metallo-hydrolase [Streptomyces sp. NPDC006422]|uniref:MBL fold metallo-hydrolase n=1 Tax=unclassified Streptomyces TaxID=2593676 RepID=UPI0033AF3AB1